MGEGGDPSRAGPPGSPDRATPTVLLERDGPVAVLRLERPEKLNVLSPVEHRLLQEILAGLATDFETRVVVLTGAGRAFSAGADLANPREQGKPRNDLERRHRARLGDRTVAAIERLDQITIAAINGPCVGGGAVLALACDMRVISRDAWIAVPEVDIAMPLTWGALPLLVREIGPARTLELVTTCDRVTAGEAHRIGLVNRVADDALDEALALARQIAAKPAVPVAMTKAQVRALRAGAAQGDATYADGDLYWLGVKTGGLQRARPPRERSSGPADPGPEDPGPRD